LGGGSNTMHYHHPHYGVVYTWHSKRGVYQSHLLFRVKKSGKVWWECGWKNSIKHFIFCITLFFFVAF